MQRQLVTLAALALFCVAPARAADDVKSIASAVDKRYNALQTFKADFTETYTGNGISRRESGALTMMRPGKMRWDYRQPVEKLFVSDGKIAYFYVPGEKQARRTPVKKLDDFRSPLRYLLGKTKLEKEFDGLRLADAARPSDPANILLEGVPKKMADRVSRVLFEITPKYQIRRIVIEEVDGAVTEFQFSNIQENAAVAESEFRFVPPKGVEMVEAAELDGD